MANGGIILKKYTLMVSILVGRLVVVAVGKETKLDHH